MGLDNCRPTCFRVSDDAVPIGKRLRQTGLQAEAMMRL
jgi:hypothetical protein